MIAPLYKVRLMDGNRNPFFFFGKQVDPLGVFLYSDVQEDQEYADSCVEFITDVQKGSVCDAELEGESCMLYITKETTEIFDNLTDDDQAIKEVVVGTDWLKTIILLWIREVNKFSIIKRSKEWRFMDTEFAVYCFLASVFHTEIKDFDCALKEYLDSESDASKSQLKKAIELFLQSPYLDAQKIAYIKQCADGLAFDSLGLDPLRWLSTILEQIKR